jgi:aryl-alcohol dehydrogenase-like predicted oxidoreductase
MSFERIDLRPGYSISRVIKGHWQISEGHLIKGSINRKQAIEDMRAFVEAGITTFDMADIYTGAEEMVGEFRAAHPDLPIQIHTKYVPDINKLATLRFEDTQAVIDRSLERLGVDCLDLVQFHWWDYAVGDYVEAALHLKKLQQAGKIRYIGVTNFDETHLQRIMDAGVEIVGAQVQYSVLDRRPEKGFATFCQRHNIHLLCYGTLAGGFISNRYLGQIAPQDIENRSLVKYRLIIDEIGGWGKYQEILKLLDEIARPYNVTLSEIASAYILTRPQVAGTIVGAHNASHIEHLRGLISLKLADTEIEKISQFLRSVQNVQGDIYEVERNSPVHKGIMKLNLNSAEA